MKANPQCAATWPESSHFPSLFSTSDVSPRAASRCESIANPRSNLHARLYVQVQSLQGAMLSWSVLSQADAGAMRPGTRELIHPAVRAHASPQTAPRVLSSKSL